LLGTSNAVLQAPNLTARGGGQPPYPVPVGQPPITGGQPNYGPPGQNNMGWREQPDYGQGQNNMGWREQPDYGAQGQNNMGWREQPSY
ncbi:hypothetical protein V502_09475, partial [Pseudogymnoascus sp. VKM F-4520 (FW-2644)]